MFVKTINNIQIHQYPRGSVTIQTHFDCKVRRYNKTIHLETFDLLPEAEAWCRRTHDYLSRTIKNRLRKKAAAEPKYVIMRSPDNKLGLLGPDNINYVLMDVHQFEQRKFERPHGRSFTDYLYQGNVTLKYGLAAIHYLNGTGPRPEGWGGFK